MFSLLVDKEPSDEDIPGDEEVEEEEEEEQPPNEQTVFLNQEIDECFALFDKNKTGTFQLKYLEKALKCLGIFLTSHEIEELRENLDTDGLVTYEQFHDYAFEKLTECDPVEAMKIAFQAFDPDNEGILPRDRVKRWLMTLGDPLTEKEAKEVVKLGDPSGKGLIVYDDLVMLLVRS